MPVPDNIRRIFALIVPAITALFLFFGSIAGIGLNNNMAQTGITPAIILGLTQIILLFIIYRRRVP